MIYEMIEFEMRHCDIPLYDLLTPVAPEIIAGAPPTNPTVKPTKSDVQIPISGLTPMIVAKAIEVGMHGLKYGLKYTCECKEWKY